ncbi:MAG: histone deacetylase family protein, partial [Rhodospirillales bacterium]|nr:histone deacetylase family protein [Rhodospirillales bacterium]
NFEVPARAEALRSALVVMGLAPVAVGPAARAALEAVHSAGYLGFLEGAHAAWQALPGAAKEAVANIHPAPEMLAQGAIPGGLIGKLGWYTADTACPIGPHTWAASVDAAGCALAAAEAVLAGGSAYALCRPPGHHTYAARAGGHCYLNNAAIAVEALRRGGAARVAVLDIDSHHGNGTQGIFWERSDVLTVSVHGDPDGYYPWYVGRSHERGAGVGEGCNLNLPLPLGSNDGAWLGAIATGIARIRDFAPDALVVSLGFDASVHEPLNALSVSDEGFGRAAEAIAALGLPVALIQEGGYAVDHLSALLTGFMQGFLNA